MQTIVPRSMRSAVLSTNVSISANRAERRSDQGEQRGR